MNAFRSHEYDTDKSQSYIYFYEQFFAPFRDRPVNLLELGVHRGGSLKMWRDYFQLGQIYGVDLAPPQVSDLSRIHMFAGDAGDPATFDRIEKMTGCDVFDIIIDDASHIGSIAERSFAALFEKRLKPGGLYVIEDWGTGYRGDWPDGQVFVPPTKSLQGAEPHYRFASHDHGMVGWLKSLVDLVGQGDLRASGGKLDTPSVDFMMVTPGVAFLKRSP